MIRPIIILAIRAYCQHFYVLVKSDNNIAAPFLTTYGVKQGGIISSELYKLYSEQIAIQYGKMNIDIIMYADDIIIIARTATEAQIMLNVLSEFSNSHQIKFNAGKTNLVIFNPKTKDKTLTLFLCGKPIIRTNSLKYLGTEIKDNYTNRQHIDRRRQTMISSLNSLLNNGIMNKQMNEDTK